MKSKLTLLFACLSSISYSQLTVIGGIDRRLERYDFKSYFTAKPFENLNVNTYNHFGVNFKKKKISTQLSLSYIIKKDQESNAVTENINGGGNNPYFYSLIHRTALFDIHHLSFKFQLNRDFDNKRIFFNKNKSAISIGSFINLDCRVKEIEKNHLTHYYSYNTNNMFHQTVVTEDSYSSEKFDAVVVKKSTVNIGVHFIEKMYSNHFFFQYRLAVGFIPTNRITQNFQYKNYESYSTEETKLFNPTFEISLVAGYVFKKGKSNE